MDLSRILNMVINMVVRKLIGKGVDAGINYATRRGKTDEEMTPEDHAQAQEAKLMAKRARQAAGLARRIGK
jgi:hypothetical protein